MRFFSRLTGVASMRRLVWLALIFSAFAGAQSGPDPVDAAALARFERAVELAPQNPAEAVQMFEALTRDHPGWPEPYNNLAVLYAQRGEEKKAEQALISAMGTHPTYALVHKNLEALYAGMAGRAYRKALNDDSTGPAPPKLALANRIETATVEATRPAIPLAAGEASPGPEPEPEPVAVVASTVPAAPQPEPVAPESGEDARRAVLSTVASWLEAWSSQDVERYLSFYGHHFEPGKGMTRDHWAELRRKRVAAPEFIDLDIQNPSITFQAPDRASVRFLQIYRSNTFDGKTLKTLRLSRGSDGWKIVGEETGG